ncbi:uncharacterized protein LOC127244099 [Andrographis paniculata]|uniref:uncharacterized protein LOC127244099 n=1 Tax=Andrographis paniculata TaxID=175694 RepID=UPI0021E6F1DB|nr:uncharacterized protein LOC127244099 [Andrographis paniculata]
MPPLSWRQHTLIQALLSRGPLKEADFLSIFLQVTGKSGSQQQLLNDYLRKINAELAYVQLELRACRNQYNGEVYYGVINNVSDDQSKLGTKYTVPQIAFYKGIIEAIIQDEEARGCISNNNALYIRLEAQVTGEGGSLSQADSAQVPPAIRNFSMSQKEKTLEQLVKDQWLCSLEDGKIGIGVRSFLDLRSWFRTNEVPACEICNEAAVKAEPCQSEDCRVRLHLYCLEKKFSRHKAERVCPGCGTQWRGYTAKEEPVQEVDNVLNAPPPSQNSGSNTRKRKKPQREQPDSNNAGLGFSQTSNISRRMTRSSARQR